MMKKERRYFPAVTDVAVGRAFTTRSCAAGEGSSATRGRVLRGAPTHQFRTRPRLTWQLRMRG